MPNWNLIIRELQKLEGSSRTLQELIGILRSGMVGKTVSLSPSQRAKIRTDAIEEYNTIKSSIVAIDKELGI
jgi:hypothetical protein